MHYQATNLEVPLLGGKTIGLLALVAISGVTGSVGVLVDRAAPRRVSTPALPAPRAERPHLERAEDVRTTALHRAHLAGSRRLDCTDCHELAASEFRRPTMARCLGCHERHEPKVHATTPACLSCHDFLRATSEVTCEACHADRQGTHRAIAFHTKRCAECHVVHEQRTAVVCGQCHAKQSTAHAGGDVNACLGCHPPHTAAASAAERCTACHVDNPRTAPAIPASATFKGGHERCVQCHDNHAFTKAAVRGCRDCHRDRPVAPAHAACTGCHDPHDAPAHPTAQRCVTCHAGKHVIAQERVAAHADCTSCHDPHRPTAAPGERCAGCHRAIAASSHSRGRACISCHPPHADMNVAASCQSCHAEPRQHGRAACRDCHPQHGVVPAPVATFCLGCHQQRISPSAGHAQCTACHATAAHRPSAPRPACATCHAAEASTAPAGHSDCKSCHDVHSGKRKVDCATCHADRTRTPHVKLGCQTCHRPHGPGGQAAVPACRTCHGELPGMHRVAKHATCTDCHTAHKPQVRDRETCLRCHVDRRNHEPQAVVCQACHTFEDRR